MDYFIFALLWVIFTVLGEFGANWAIAHYPTVGAVQGQITDEAIFFLLRASIPVFVFVTLWIVYSMIRFRARKGEEGPGPIQVRDNWRFSWSWFILSAAVNVLFIIHPGITGLNELWALEKAKEPLVVNVTAKQWEWSFSYPEYGIENSPLLVVPVDRDEKFVLQTEDVMHSFWIPSFRMKKAVMPGETRVLYMKPTKISSTEEDPLTRVQCAQICGIGHAEMRAEVRVISAGDFQKWVKMNANKNLGEEMNMNMDMNKDSNMNMDMNKDSNMNMDMNKDSNMKMDMNTDSNMKMDMNTDSNMKMDMNK